MKNIGSIPTHIAFKQVIIALNECILGIIF